MSKEKNINLVKKLHHIWNTGEVNLIPEVYAENIIVHWAKGWGLPSKGLHEICLLYTSPSPRDSDSSRMPSSA